MCVCTFFQMLMLLLIEDNFSKILILNIKILYICYPKYFLTLGLVNFKKIFYCITESLFSHHSYSFSLLYCVYIIFTNIFYISIFLIIYSLYIQVQFNILFFALNHAFIFIKVLVWVGKKPQFFYRSFVLLLIFFLFGISFSILLWQRRKC